MVVGLKIRCVVEDLFLCLVSNLGKDLNSGVASEKGVFPLLIDAIFVLSKKKPWTISSSIVSRQDLRGSSSSPFLGLLG